jgi:hypothetical protein
MIALCTFVGDTDRAYAELAWETGRVAFCEEPFQT